jgi:predicted ester cyclase
MGLQNNKAVVLQLVEELWNRGNTGAIETFFSPELAVVVAQHHRELVEAFSDLRVTVDDILEEGDRVAARLTISGTHDAGPFAGQAPTGRKIRYGSFRFYRLADGQVVETWAMQDRLGLLQQLGAVPEPTGDVEWASQRPS